MKQLLHWPWKMKSETSKCDSESEPKEWANGDLVMGSFASECLKELTQNFSEENYIGRFQFGKLYRGIYIGKEVVVKIWEESGTHYPVYPGDNFSRVMDEVKLFTELEVKRPSDMFRMIGYNIVDEPAAVVYEIKPLDTVYNLLPKDSFTWLQRIKVAIRFAAILENMHNQTLSWLPILVRNVDAAHILLDQDHNPKLIDFSMISGGFLSDKRFQLNQYLHGCHGYIDPHYALRGEWSEKCDVFAFGVVLLGLITKRVYPDCDNISMETQSLYDWARREYKQVKSTFGICQSECSLVHPSLEADATFCLSDGPKITKLAMQCISCSPQKRPTMKHVIRCLLDLHGVKHHIRTCDQKPHEGNWSPTFVNSVLPFKCCLHKWTPSFLLSNVFSPWTQLSFLSICFDRLKRKGGRKEKEMLKMVFNSFQNGNKPNAVKLLSWKDLEHYTNGLSEANLIGKFQFGKVYRGRISEQEVTVKIWESPKVYTCCPGDNEVRLRDELLLLQHPRLAANPNLVHLIGYCFEGERLGAAYDLRPLDTVYNLLLKGKFTWRQRFKVGLGFASLLEFLHTENPPHLQYLVRNIDAAHILVDKDYNPKLFEFGMFTGGILPDRRFDRVQYVSGCYGYIDFDHCVTGVWSDKRDVYSFGMVLLGLITNKVYTEEDVLLGAEYHDKWAQQEYESKLALGCEPHKLSLVDTMVAAEHCFCPGDGPKITRLALDCLEPSPASRPTMKQVVERLLDLRVASCHADALGVDQIKQAHKKAH